MGKPCATPQWACKTADSNNPARFLRGARTHSDCRLFVTTSAGTTGLNLREANTVINVDLWQTLHALAQEHTMSYEYVRGHTGHPENEECDRMAVEAIEAVRSRI